uniref:Secreted protein n=1 Tax=Rhipicephalus zambeziensis TaxID=60191 RepID=A0A224Y780_9ACAR
MVQLGVLLWQNVFCLNAPHTNAEKNIKSCCFQCMPHALYSPDLSRNMFYTFTPCHLGDKSREVHSQYNTHAQVLFLFHVEYKGRCLHTYTIMKQWWGGLRV